jgi:hypothetical protein
MDYKIKLLPPTMQNFICTQQPVGLRQDGFTPGPTIPVYALTDQEAELYAEEIKQNFIAHHRRLVQLHKTK